MFMKKRKVVVGVAYNQYQVTRFGDLRCSDILLDGNDILDSNGTTRITVGSTIAITGALTTTGAITPSGAFVVYASTAPRSATVGVTPPTAGAIIYNSTDKELCMATATNSGAWIRVSISSTPAVCLH
jgi:hypothetical protein